jgi:hypothetical protein
MNIRFEMKDHNRVANNLRRFASESPQVTDGVVGDWSKDMRYMLKAKPYPPKLPNQRYIRTGRLANSWRAFRVKLGEWTIANDARSPRTSELYASRVVGDNRGLNQHHLFRGRWWIARQEIENFAGDLTRRLSRALIKFWGR